jgi:acetyl esterase/lipase
MADPKTFTYRTVGGQALELDLYLPESTEGLRPGVLFIHGGGWNGGRRTQFSWHAKTLAEAGFVAATASYRMAAVAPYPAALDDCQCAVRWLRAHAADFQLDPARIGAFGSSAGGHLVACLGVRETREEVDPAWRGFSSRVQAAVDVHGVHDLTVLATPNHLSKTLDLFLGGTYEEKSDAWRDASPELFIAADTAPMFLAHDPADPTVPYDQTVRFAHALMKAARPFEFLPTPGSGHGYVYNPENEWSKRVFPRAQAFLSQWLSLVRQ